MSTTAPPIVGDGAPQSQELEALRKQLADLQVGVFVDCRAFAGEETKYQHSTRRRSWQALACHLRL